ncbi:MAG: CDP-alcohol phosphatidyltransferase family protein [Opitutaceae bacterium]
MPRNIANVITGCRILLAPVLLLLAWLGKEQLFLACLIVSLLSDIIDGQIARRFGLASELGSRLDSWADLLTYAAVPVATAWLRPDLVTSEKVAFIAAVTSYALPVVVGFMKFRQLTSYHSFGARVSAYLLGAAVVVLFAHGPHWPFRMAVCVLVLAELEEIAITFVLPEPRSGVRSLGKALEIRRQLLSPTGSVG